jgi:TRAP transporter TAXI family solute receptor
MRRVCQFLLVSVFIWSAFFGLVVSSSSAADLPKLVTMTSYKTGSFGYVATSGFREAIEQKTPMKARVEPYDSDPSRILPLKTGEAELSILTGSSGCAISYGLGDFGKKEWGPQPLRQVWRGNELYLSLATREDSGISQPKDLKGKRIPNVPGWAAGMLCIEATMAFGQVTWKDVKKVPLGGYIQQLQALQEGVIDVAWAATVTPKMKEIASGPRGLKWVALPHDDAEGWKRMQEVAPWLNPVVAKKGTGITGPTEIATYPYSLWTWDHIDADVIYHIVKSLDQGYDIFKGMHPFLKYWTVEGAVQNPSPVPYHEGAIRYFKEAGVWTSAMDQWQEQQLKDFKARQAAFK